MVETYSNIYRVIDACVDAASDACYIYVRDYNTNRHTITIRPLYEIIIGSDNIRTLSNTVEDITSKYAVRITSLGEQSTYYRGRRNIMSIVCPNYKLYSTVSNKLRYDYKGHFLCESFCTLESKTLMHYGIYGAEYVYYDSGNIRPANEDQRFPYTPKVCGIDLEMMSLNHVDPNCMLYMASYYSKDVSVVIYTSDYVSDSNTSNVPVTNHADESGAEDYCKDIKYIQVSNKYELAKKLSDVIAHESPDILTGYNIYLADIPLLYFTIRSCMGRWTKMCDGPEAFFQYTRKLDKGYMESESGIAVKIPGCHAVDMYYFLEKTLPSEDKSSLKLGDVAAKYIGSTKDPFTYRDLAKVYYGGTMSEKFQVMRYCLRDSYLSVQLYNKFNVWNYNSSMYSISGIDPQRSACSGIVDITYGMCYIASKYSGIYIDQPDNRIFSPSGGLVLPSVKGMYNDVHCIDLNSLYPNITIQHNIDAMSVVRATLDQVVAKHGPITQESYYYVTADRNIVGLLNSRGQLVFFDQTKYTILPNILRNLLKERDAIKKELSTLPKGSVEYLSSSGREQARKIAANGSCGALAEQTEGNPMSYCELNDVITTTGRHILLMSQNTLLSRGVLVIYGDTDSLMIYINNSRCSRVEEHIESIHSLVPDRIRFKVEYVAKEFIMGTKKHYIVRTSDSTSSNVKIVGYKSVKSSSCRAAQKLFYYIIDKLLNEGPDSAMRSYTLSLAHYLSIADTLDMELFVSRFSYTGKSYSQGSYRYKIISCMNARGVELVAGNTLTVIVVKSLEDYLDTFREEPPIPLPYFSQGKASRIYTIDEIGIHSRVVDVVAILEQQCGSDIRTIMSNISSSHTE